MDYTTFKQAASDAERIVQETDAADFVQNTDTIVMMCYLELLLRSTSTATVAVHTATPAIPEWFTETLSRMTESRVTSSQVFHAAGKKPSMLDLRMAGGWLRSLYGEPKRSNGQILFTLPLKEATQPKAAKVFYEQDTLPLDACIGQYLAITDEPFTIEEMLHSIGFINDKDTHGEAHRLLAVKFKMTEDSAHRFRKLR